MRGHGTGSGSDSGSRQENIGSPDSLSTRRGSELLTGDAHNRRDGGPRLVESRERRLVPEEPEQTAPTLRRPHGPRLLPGPM